MKSKLKPLITVLLAGSICSVSILPLVTSVANEEASSTVEEILRSQLVKQTPADAEFFNLTPEEEARYAVEDPRPANGPELSAENQQSDETGKTNEEPGEGKPSSEDNQVDGELADNTDKKVESEGITEENSNLEEQKDGSFFNRSDSLMVKEITVPAPFYADADSYTLPGINGVQWIVNGQLKDAGTHKIQTAKQRKRLIISAWTADAKQFRLVGTTSWVLQPGTFAPTQSNLTDNYLWEPRQQIGHGWTGKTYSAGNFDWQGGQDIFRITPQGQLILYRTFSLGRFANPIYYGYGWNAMTQLATGYDFNGDNTPDILAADNTGRLYLYPGNGAGGFKSARIAFGYGWNTFKKLALLPATSEFGPRLVAIHKSGQMFVYEGNGAGGFKGGRKALGFGWDTMHSVNPGADWNHDGKQDLLVVNRFGHLLLYKGNSIGYWGMGIKIGQGWSVMPTIMSIADNNENVLWTIDRSNRLWHYKNKHLGHVSASVNANWGFNTSGFTTQPNASYPYSHNGGWVKTAWQVDANNVPIVKVPGLMNGQRIYHPVAYSRFALDAVENYMGNPPSALRNRELERAKAGAQALVDGAILDEDTLWFPYSFPYNAMGSGENSMPVPWVSSMSQGFALATFVRLAQATGDIKWRQYADMTFASYFAEPGERFWITYVDDSGDLWLEEYPGPPIPSKVLNGHLFSAEGLQYYYLDTKNAYAEGIIDGAVTSVVNEFDNYRTPGRSSLYCASIFCWRVGKNPVDYHKIVANQIRDFGISMNQPRLTELATILRRDK